MYIAWDNGRWHPVDERDIPQVEAMGYEVLEVEEGTVIAAEWLDPEFRPDSIARWLEQGLAQLSEYLRVRPA